MAEINPSKWRARIQRSLDLQKPRKEEAARFLRGYTGDYNNKPRKGLEENRDEMVVNFIFSYIETVRPTIFPGNPRAFVEGMDPESEKWAPHYQAVINHWARTLGLKKEFKKSCFDWFFGPTSFLTEWEYEEKALMDPRDPSGKTKLIDPTTGKPAFKILRDQPLAKRLDPWDVIVDPDSRTREEDRWRARRILMTKEEFDSLPGVGSKAKKEIRGRAIPRELTRQPFGEDRNASNEKNWVVLWRIYDLDNETVKLLPDGENVKDFVEMKDWPWLFEAGGDRYPVTILEAKQDAGSPYSFSGFKAYWAQIQERNKLRTMLQSHVRRNAPGWLMKKGAMDEEQKSKFVEALIGELVEVNNPEMIVARPNSQLSSEFFAHDKAVADDTLNVSGLYEYSNDSIADTATEASLLDSRSSIRKGEAKGEFSDFTATILNKIGQLSQQFMSEKVAIKIKKPGSYNELGWISVNKDQIQGEFNLNVKPGIDESQNESMRRQQDLKFAELMASNPHIDQRKLAERLSRRFDIEPEEILKDPAEVQKEQEMAAMANQKPEKPDIAFKQIDVALLPAPIQAAVVAAAMKQNEVAAPGMEMGAGLPPNTQAIGNPGLPASTSLSDPAPSDSVMPGAEMNQAPPALPGANSPPMTPVQPASEFQGGPQ